MSTVVDGRETVASAEANNRLPALEQKNRALLAEAQASRQKLLPMVNVHGVQVSVRSFQLMTSVVVVLLSFFVIFFASKRTQQAASF